MGDSSENKTPDILNPTFWESQKQSGPATVQNTLNDPQELWNLGCEYFGHVGKNPWQKSVIRGKAQQPHKVPIVCPFLIEEFEEFLYSKSIKVQFKEYRASKASGGIFQDQAFLEILERIENVMCTHNKKGAILGEFNVTMIMAEYQMATKVELEAEIKQKQVFVIGGQEIVLG